MKNAHEIKQNAFDILVKKYGSITIIGFAETVDSVGYDQVVTFGNNDVSMRIDETQWDGDFERYDPTTYVYRVVEIIECIEDQTSSKCLLVDIP